MKKASYIIFRLLKKKKNNEINSDKIIVNVSYYIGEKKYEKS